MQVVDLGQVEYRTAWALQEKIHADVLQGAEERLLLVEHPAVISLGRRPGIIANFIASKEQLTDLGVDLVESDRGGDITFHGPGQIVAYPIVRLADHELSVSGYVHTLEKIIIEMLNGFGIEGRADPTAVGVWVQEANGDESKIAAIGVRIRRGVALHGLALNVTTDLSYFDLIIPCGLSDRGVTSLSKLLGNDAPSMERVKSALTHQVLRAFA